MYQFKKLLRKFGFELTKNRVPDDTWLYRELYGDESVERRRFYNIAAGAYKGFGGGITHPCWTNIDVNRPWKNDKYFPGGLEFSPARDIAHDLLDMIPIPVESGSAELVYSRFTIDRITDDAAQYFFNEVYRLLKHSGLFRLVSTNLDLDYRAYCNNDHDYYFWLDDDVSIEQAFLFHVVTQVSKLYHDSTTPKIGDMELRQLFASMDYESAVSHCTSKCSVEIHKRNRYDHFNWWNPKKLERMLRLAGFKDIYLSAPEQSAAAVLRNQHVFDNEHNRVMMYMEAVKG